MSKTSETQRVVIVGAGFAGLKAAKMLGRDRNFEVVVVDRRNHHLFQPLLYQVAMAGLSPADIAAPIRSLLAPFANVRVIQGGVETIDAAGKKLRGDFGELGFDFLLVAAGAQHTYFGHEEWEEVAPGLKTLEQATEIRRRVLTAYELAERSAEVDERRAQLSFVIVGGGPTGVELAGAIGEMSRYTLARDFRNIDPKLTRVVLIEAGPRILAGFSPEISSRATRDLEGLGVQVWTDSYVTKIDAQGVEVGGERLQARTVLWAAGVQASPLGAQLGAPTDRAGRVKVQPDLSVEGEPNIFVAGDLAYLEIDGRPLPGQAPIALQQGAYVARMIQATVRGGTREPFTLFDKGQMATIGRRRAVVERGSLRLGGLVAWWAWLLVHIYYLSGFRNRILVLIQWAWSYLTFARGARLIVGKSWRSYAARAERADKDSADSDQELETPRARPA